MLKTRLYLGASVVIAALILTDACSAPSHKFPDITRLFPNEKARSRSSKVGSVVVDIDGTLSMQGFAKAPSGDYGELLQSLYRALNNVAGGQSITYRRFGSRAENVTTADPIYIAASRPDFYQATQGYAKTRADMVLKDNSDASIRIVITDLFEDNEDISGIEQALRSSGFPASKAVGIWQWALDFDGTIYDFDVRQSKGVPYEGKRPLYFVIVAPESVIQQFSNALRETWTKSQPRSVILSPDFSLNPNDWLKLSETQSLAIVQRLPGTAPLTVFRTANGCGDAELGLAYTMRPSSSSISLTRNAVLGPGEVEVSLFRVMEDKSISLVPLEPPEVQVKSNNKQTSQLVNIRIPCHLIPSGSLYALQVKLNLKLDDFEIPSWVQSSTATGNELQESLARNDKQWGNKTLNLLPLLRDLLSSEARETPLGGVYFYIDRR